MPKKTETILRICHTNLKGKILSENRYVIKNNSSEESIIKVFCAITSYIKLRSGITPMECTKTTLEVIKTDVY